jgi:hypothetical protein
MHYNKQITGSDNKVKTICKTIKKKTGKHSAAEDGPSVKMNDNIIKVMNL